MTKTDEWGKDPSVQRTRRLFCAMEEAQWALLKQLNLSPLDERLRRWRERARIAFDAAYARAARAGVNSGEEEAAELYLRCFASIVKAEGVELPDAEMPGNERVRKILKEVFS
jgi:hypothetical protein